MGKILKNNSKWLQFKYENPFTKEKRNFVGPLFLPVFVHKEI